MDKYDVTQKMIILDSESFAAIRANNLTLDDLSEAVFGTMDILSVNKKSWEEKKFVRKEIKSDEHNLGIMKLDTEGNYNYWQGSDMLESAKKQLSKIFKISKNDLRYLLSKNILYFSLFNLTNYSQNLGYLLSNKWWYNDEEADALDGITPIKNYSVDVDNLQAFDSYCWGSSCSGELGESYRDVKYLKHVTSKGIIIVLTSGVIKNLMTKDKNTTLYFYEDMLCELSKFVDKKVLYKTDLYLNYLNI